MNQAHNCVTSPFLEECLFLKSELPNAFLIKTHNLAFIVLEKIK